jgi:hypothetical protein
MLIQDVKRGMVVFWTDPDEEDSCSGLATVVIGCEAGDDEDTIVSLLKDDGGEVECLAAEIEEVDPRIVALCRHDGCDPSDVVDEDDGHYSVGRREFLVLPDAEADTAVKEHLKESVWCADTAFVLSHTKLPWEAHALVKSFQEKLRENANDTLLALLKDFDAFARESVSADGRGHFLAAYDGHEHEESGYYIYRLN